MNPARRASAATAASGACALLRAADVGWLVSASLAGLAIGVIMLAMLLPAAIVSNVAALFGRR
ncbi:MAG: hypothetical protein LC659_07550 [Myxococcales bacterium]|nr:hypothetical protein [Myxococcales bacterium]